MKHLKLEDLSTMDQALILIDYADLVQTTHIYPYSVLLYSINAHFWELIYNNQIKRVHGVRRVTPGILDQYLADIELPHF